MLCGHIMFACTGQAACCGATQGNRWHYGPQWGSKGLMGDGGRGSWSQLQMQM